jgi:hypothetical protein
MLKSLALVLIASVSGLLEGDSATWYAGAYWFSHPNSSGTMRLVITPDSRFDLTEYGCFGSSVNRGRVAIRNGILMLEPASPVAGFMSNSLVPVRFRENLYLVNSDRIGEFVATTHGGNGDCRGTCPGFFVRESALE